MLTKVHSFMTAIPRLREANYVPDTQDVLHSRRTTRGIQEETFNSKTGKLVIVDVGGQRGERRKWIHLFSGITAVIFVAGLSEYDQVVAEDGKTVPFLFAISVPCLGIQIFVKNRLIEALDLFEEIVNHSAFANTVFILFLNKSDLFRAKLPKSDFKSFFPGYDGIVSCHVSCVPIY